MRKFFAIVLVMVLTLTLLAGCGSKDAVLSGKYVDKASNNSYEFFENGKCIMGVMGVTSSEITYSIKGSEVTLNFEYGSYKGKINGNKITVTEWGEEVVYEKQ